MPALVQWDFPMGFQLGISGNQVVEYNSVPSYFPCSNKAFKFTTRGNSNLVPVSISYLQAVEEVIRGNRRIPHARSAMHKVREMAQPVTLTEMMAITEVWVDTALQLGEKSMRTMERLVRAQYRRHGEHVAAQA